MASELKVLVGRHNLRIVNEEGSTVRTVKKIHMHPDWNYTSEVWDADLAVLVLKTPVELTSYINPICLPADENIEDHDHGTIVRTICSSSKLVF